MRPAASVILFTALSGLGFGLMAFLALGLVPVGGLHAFVFWFVGYALAVGQERTQAGSRSISGRLSL
jgi:sulfite dehydrogenase (quinone) subunit SoeC